MSFKLTTELNTVDVHLLKETIDGFVPEKVFDVHAHLFHSQHFQPGTCPKFLEENRGYGLPEFKEAMGRWLPDRTIEGLFFGFPASGNDRRGENAWVDEQIGHLVQSSNTRGLVLAAPQDDPAEVHTLMSGDTFVGIKPYRLYADVPDTRVAEIETFAPEWMWELCHEHDGVMVLHIMRDAGIADPVNIETIRRLCRRYPRCRLVLAHVARAFNYRQARQGLPAIADLENVCVDVSAVTQTGAMRAAIEILGPQRVLWGSDYMVSEFRGSCLTHGNGFTWIYANDESARELTVFGQYTLVGIESLMCLREACDDTGMKASDVNDIFRNNALRLLAPHLQENSIPKVVTGPQLWSDARTKISCGTGLLSKRAELFDPLTWPSYFSRCKGPDIWDLEGRRFSDFTGGVGAILLGHADPDVNSAVHRRVNLGSYATLVSPEEVELADLLLSLHPWAGKVRYARGGGEALGLAVRIARAATGKSGIAFCGYHGWNDWYLAANLGDTDALDGHLLPGLKPLGVPRELAGTAVPFRYNDFTSFEKAINKLEGKLAAVVMEPMRSEFPRDGFVEKVAAACRGAGGVFMLDEVTSGWRFGFPGAASKLGIEPDIAVYAKAISNGFPCAAVVGRDAIMEAANSSFISSSCWTDGVGTAAALACLSKMQREGVQAYVWSLGERLQNGLREAAARYPQLKLKIGGMPCSPSIVFQRQENSIAAKRAMIREMLSRGFLMSSQLYVTWAQTDDIVRSMLAAFDDSLHVLGKMQDQGLLKADSETSTAPQGFARLV